MIYIKKALLRDNMQSNQAHDIHYMLSNQVLDVYYNCSNNILTSRSKAVLLLVIPFAMCVSCLSLSYCLVCFIQPCSHLLGKGWPRGYLVYDILLCFCHFKNGILGQVWYLIVTILIFVFFLSSIKDNIPLNQVHDVLYIVKSRRDIYYNSYIKRQHVVKSSTCCLLQ